MKANRKTTNWTYRLYWRQIHGSTRFESTLWKKPLRCRYLLELVPKQSALNKIFLGFSTDGNFMFSYTFKTSCNESGMDLYVFKYKLQIWRFVPGKKLVKVRSLKLFPEARICSELHITLTQFPCDPHVVMVFGLEAQSDRDSNIDEASTETYFSIISLKRYLLHNGNFCCKQHNLIANFSMICTVSGDIPLFNCFAGSGVNVCTVFDDSTVSASAILDIETLLQDACEMVCKRNNLTFVGFRDYETYVVDVLDSYQIAILFGVLIEMEEADYPLAEIVFLFTGNLLSPDLVPHRVLVSSETKNFPFSSKNSKWSSLKTLRRELLLQRVVTSKFFQPHILTNTSVLNRKSLPYMLDFDGLFGVVL